MKWPSFESLIVTFVTFFALSPCVIYFMTAADDNGSSGSMIIKNLSYLGMNLTLVSAMLWAIHKKFMEEPPCSYVPTFYRRRKQFQQSPQYSFTSSNQGHGAKDKDAKSCDSSTSKRRYFRKNKRFRNSKRVKPSKWVSRKRPCGKRLFVGYLGIIMSLITTATAVPVMVEGLENTNGYSNNLQFVTCLELLNFLSIPLVAAVVYGCYTEHQQQQPSSSVFKQRNSARVKNTNTNENTVASGSNPSKMRLPCLDTVFIWCMAIVIFSPCSLSLAFAVDMNNWRIKNYFSLGFFLTSVSVISWVVGRSCSVLESYHEKLLQLKMKEAAARAQSQEPQQQQQKEQQNSDENRQQQSSSSSSSIPSSPSSSSCLDPFYHLTQQYTRNGESVKMDQRRRCSKSVWRGGNRKTVLLGEEKPLEYTADGASYTPLSVEMRGMTIRQLRAVRAMAEEKCVKDNWVDWKGNPITPDKVTLYDIDKYIIRPYTKKTKRSFVETLPSTAGTQPPLWFVSHWWGESFGHTMDCLETFLLDFKVNFDDKDDARGGGMTEDTPIWICAFANNQWALEEDMATDPQESSFTKAMRVARFRTLSILDSQATVFTRIWCVYELYLTLILRTNDPSLAGLWVVYTALRHTYCRGGFGIDEDRVAVGIIPGGAPGEFSNETSRREKHFPPDLVSKSHSIDIATAIASVPADGIRILNSIVKSEDLNAPPPTTHANYVSLNESVKAAFVSSQRALDEAHKAGGEEWKSTLEILSKGKMTDTFTLDFNHFSRRLSSLEAHELICHLPLTCTGLCILNADEKDGEGAIDGMLEWLAKKEANSLTYLWCAGCKVGDLERGRAVGSRLAALLKSNHAQSMEGLYISNTDLMDSGNVSDWKSALEAMTNLKELYFYKSGLSEEERNILRNATHASDVTIN